MHLHYLTEISDTEKIELERVLILAETAVAIGECQENGWTPEQCAEYLALLRLLNQRRHAE